jgi:SpoVK/Ycf46/Vps4 family AAA+-type ATPase
MEELIIKYKEKFKDFGQIFIPSEIDESVDDLVGLDDEKQLLDDFFGALKNSYDVIKNLSFKINFSMLLFGPPGTGKTTIVKAMAKKYKMAILLVYADKLVGSYLGETMRNFGAVIDSAVYIVEKIEMPLILFIDEIDAIASERSNPNDVAEVKRSVVSFLQHFDKAFLKKSPLAVIAATNHEDLLDSAVWRRFTYNLEFKFPSEDLRFAILEFYLDKLLKGDIGLDFTYEELKRVLYENPENDILDGFTGSDIERAVAIALLKGLNTVTNKITLNMMIDSIVQAGGTKSHQKRKQAFYKKQSDKYESNKEDIWDV